MKVQDISKFKKNNICDDEISRKKEATLFIENFINVNDIPETVLKEYKNIFLDFKSWYLKCTDNDLTKPCAQNMPGYEYYLTYSKGVIYTKVKDCVHAINQISLNHIKNNYLYFNFNNKFLEFKNKKRKDDHNSYTTCLEKLHNSILGKQGLYIYGEPGCGKTKLMIGFANYLVNEKHKVCFLNLEKYLTLLKSAFDVNYYDIKNILNQEIQKIANAIINCEFLFIDDFTLINKSVWSKTKILELIEQCYENNKKIFINGIFEYSKTSNTSWNNKSNDFKDQIKENLDKKIIWRIEKMTKIKKLIKSSINKVPISNVKNNYLYFNFNNDYLDFKNKKTVNDHNSYRKCLEKLRSSILDKQGLYIYGEPGCGKTELMIGFANYLVSKKYQVCFLNLEKYFNLLKSGFDINYYDAKDVLNHEIQKIADAINNCEVLFIDDFTIISKSVWAKTKILELIEQCYENNKKIFINGIFEYSKTIDFSDQIKEKLDKKIIWRIKKLTKTVELIRKN